MKVIDQSNIIGYPNDSDHKDEETELMSISPDKTAALQQQHMGGVLNDVPLEDARRPNEKQGAHQPATYSEVRMHAFSTNIHH
ncbi:hypothetical protein G6F57_010547 [Rhizopus arrhizus]|uniref:Uncharacterized protein n=1 Tax=Rhizopus oryzae TaxID=64495 RepID=A0A9P6X1H6_RHIOR|nr:hypothetical protein G6F24_008542 [Rhizopus arrhizus]KAG1412714.1 hypothetical protein G6F58_007879 [Rhizopus delemar]KAG0783585.1 hypothetical protein G6F21_010446 [Rhizopus arrhizus]KAG0796317.1 hypothetical protein G6F22_004933 [Rhizopus arrhizus]KAG0806885.1 hypothetical protein G6F20_010775 [Rhizopus arrhizus]